MLERRNEPENHHSQQGEVSADLSSFWDVTVDSLVAFHGKTAEEALELARSYKARVRKLPPDIRKGVQTIVYHDEPFNLACRLTGKEVDARKHLAEYNEILKRHGVATSINN